MCVPLLGLSFSDVKRIFVTSWILEGKAIKSLRRLSNSIVVYTSYTIYFKQKIYYTLLYYFIQTWKHFERPPVKEIRGTQKEHGRSL